MYRRNDEPAGVVENLVLAKWCAYSKIGKRSTDGLRVSCAAAAASTGDEIDDAVEATLSRRSDIAGLCGGDILVATAGVVLPTADSKIGRNALRDDCGRTDMAVDTR